MQRVIGLFMVVASLIAIVTLACVEGAFKIDVLPQIPTEAIKLVAEPGAVQITASAPAIELPEKLVYIEPGAVQQEFSFGRYGLLVAAAAVGLLLLFMRPPTQWFKR